MDKEQLQDRLIKLSRLRPGLNMPLAFIADIMDVQRDTLYRYVCKLKRENKLPADFMPRRPKGKEPKKYTVHEFVLDELKHELKLLRSAGIKQIPITRISKIIRESYREVLSEISA